MARKKMGARAIGPYRHPKKAGVYPGVWMVAIKTPDAPQETHPYPFKSPATEAAAKLAAEKEVADYNAGAALVAGMSVEDAITAFLDDPSLKRGASVNTERSQLMAFFPAEMDLAGEAIAPRAMPAADVTSAIATAIAARYRSTPTRFKKPPADDTVRNAIMAASRLMAFCLAKKWVQTNHFAGLVVPGKPLVKRKGGKGKKSLRFDAIAKFRATGLRLAMAGDIGAAAAVMTLLGQRVTIVATRRAEDIDAGGLVLWTQPLDADPNPTKDTPDLITVVDPEMRALLLRLRIGLKDSDWVFPSERDRTRPMRREQVTLHVKRVCRLAGVSDKTHAHGMRGATGNAMLTSEVLAQIQKQYAHRPGDPVTRDSYLSAEAENMAGQSRLLQLMKGGKLG